MSNQYADQVFDALGEPVRRRILELLRDGPTPVTELASRLPVGRPAVSKHLRVLRDAGLVEHTSAGTRNLYVLAPAGLATAQQWLVRTWDSALAAYANEAAALANERRSHQKGESSGHARGQTGRGQTGQGQTGQGQTGQGQTGRAS